MITDLVLQAVSSKANLLDSFVSLYAVFVGALHRIIGVEFGERYLCLGRTDADIRRPLSTYLDHAVQEPIIRPGTRCYDIRDARRVQGIAQPPHPCGGALQCRGRRS